MKTSKFILLLIFAFVLFCGGSCEKKEGQYFITIQNNSDKEIIFTLDLYSSISQDTMCFGTMITKEYKNLIRNFMIKPNSSKKKEIDLIVEDIQKYPDFKLSIGIFNRIDVDTMSCEEFKQNYPLKKEWSLTLADMEACDWTLVYTPDE